MTSMMIHLPELRFEGPPVQFFLGKIREVSFDELSAVDGDWMRSIHINKSRPFFWVVDHGETIFSRLSSLLSDEETSAEFNPIIPAEIFLFSLRSITDYNFISSSYSTSYSLPAECGGAGRRIGPAERNLISHNPRPKCVERTTAQTAAGVAEKWLAAGGGRTANQALFEPFRTTLSHEMSYGLPWFEIVPIMVQLESMLVPAEITAKQDALITYLENNLADNEFESNSEIIRNGYRFRSKILHGDPLRAIVNDHLYNSVFINDLRRLFIKIAVINVEKLLFEKDT